MDLNDIQQRAPQEIAAAKTPQELEAMRIKYLGRKEGLLTGFLRSLKDLPEHERRIVGSSANELRQQLEALFAERAEALAAKKTSAGKLDITAPGKKRELGHLHPLTLVARDVKRVFASLGFAVVEGPEIETEYYNFDALNLPPNHPARELWDTFWLKSQEHKSTSAREQGLLLRTHTSPVQIRYMEAHEPPLAIIAPGRVFRHEATDASHQFNFYQVEGLLVSKDTSLANFKYVIQTFFRQLFKKDLTVRFRPSYFPFVEPGLEVDVSCVRCGGKGCSTCGQSGWLEVMGAGMVHPHVFEYVHYNPDEWQGFAFGFGLDRIAMMKYNIPDIRLFYEGDLRFIKQF